MPFTGFGELGAIEEAFGLLGGGQAVARGGEAFGRWEVGETVLRGAEFVAQRAREAAGDGVDQHECGDFAARDHEVA